MFNKRNFLVGLILMTAFMAHAQTEETIGGRRGWGLSGVWGGYKHQLTDFGDTRSYIKGGYFGFEFGKALLVGWGHYELKDEFKWDEIKNQDFDMYWNPLLVQYGFKNYKAIHPQIGIEAGTGRAELGADRDRIFVVQPSIGLEINILRWAHLCLDGGYRFVSDSSLPGLSNENLSGPYGQAALKFGFSWGRYHKKKNAKPKNFND